MTWWLELAPADSISDKTFSATFSRQNQVTPAKAWQHHQALAQKELEEYSGRHRQKDEGQDKTDNSFEQLEYKVKNNQNHNNTNEFFHLNIYLK